MSEIGAERLLVNVATYNERENLPSLLTEIWEHVPSADVLVIDDNSPDGTGEWCEALADSELRLHCLIRSEKLGLGSATVAAYRYAIQHDYELLLTLDGDHSHPPRFLPKLVDACHADVDVVIGSRYILGGAISDWPWYRRISSRLINAYARWMLRLRVHDCSGAFRCHRIDSLRRLNLDSIESSGYAFYEESLWHFERAGFRIEEYPIHFVDRTKGRSKIGVGEAVSAVRRITLAGLKLRFG